jgi:N-methylhydantoinase A
MKSDYRLGIDAGGTFTDFVLADKTGQVRLYKALSTPQDPTLAIRNGLKLISEDLGVRPSMWCRTAISASTAPPWG